MSSVENKPGFWQISVSKELNVPHKISRTAFSEQMGQECNS